MYHQIFYTAIVTVIQDNHAAVKINKRHYLRRLVRDNDLPLFCV